MSFWSSIKKKFNDFVKKIRPHKRNLEHRKPSQKAEQKADLEQVRQKILEKFYFYKADKPQLSGIYEALAKEPISEEDNGTYQINLAYNRKSKAKIRVSRDLRQFTLIMDSKYAYDLDK